MFTGIIEEVGEVTRLVEQGGTRRLTVRAPRTARELKTGNSVAVSGVCLTALNLSRDSFSADLAAETVARTSFSRLQEGALVNLELPMRFGERMGGHIVQGHVDGVGELLELSPVAAAEDYWLKVRVPPDLVKYVAFKGSVAVEGISLTVARIEDALLTMAIIPHTYEVTNLRSLAPGSPVNLEADVLAKYAEKLIQSQVPSDISLERLVSEGF